MLLALVALVAMLIVKLGELRMFRCVHARAGVREVLCMHEPHDAFRI